jgi:Lar family restriction alleviation protein
MKRRNSMKKEVKTMIDDYMKTEPKTPEIKNCPFCGGHASFSTRSQTPNAIIFAKCECDDCHAVIGVTQTDIAEVIKEICIAKWNRRVEQ